MLKEIKIDWLSHARPIQFSPLARFGIAVACAAGTIVLRLALDPFLGAKLPYVCLFFPAILLSAWSAGFWPSIATTALSALAADYLWLTQTGSLRIEESADLFELIVFVVVGIFMCALVEAWRVAASATAQSEQHLKVTFAHVGEAVIATDENRRIVRMNPIAETLTGWSESRVKGLPVGEIFFILDEQSRLPAHQPILDVFTEGSIHVLPESTILISRERREIPVAGSVAPIKNRDGLIAGIVVVFRDITEIRRAEKERAALIEIEPLARAEGEQLVQDLRNLQTQVDTAAANIEPSETFQRLMARTRSTLGSDTASLFLVDARGTHLIPVASDGFQAGVKGDTRIPLGKGVSGRVAESGRAMIIADCSQSEIVSPSVRLHCKSLVGVPVKVGDRLVGVILAGSSRLRKFNQADVHLLTLAAERIALTIERALFLESERAARQGAETAEEQLRLALQSGRMGTWQWTIATGEVKWSSNLEELHGFSPGAFPGTIDAVQKEIHPDDRDQVLQAVRNAIELGLEYHVEYRIVRNDQSVRWVEGRGEVFRDPAGRPERMLGVCSDVTERKQAEEQARRDAEETNRAKDEFLAMLSHELRTPLNSILGWAVILRSGELPPDRANHALEVIERNARAETQLVESLLDLSRIIAGQWQPDMDRVDLLSALQAVIDSMRPFADAKGVQLDLEVPRGHVIIIGDNVRLQQVFSNLISNAVKFTPRDGHVHVRLSRVDSRAEIQVADDGEGIGPEFLPLIFEKFRQADGVRKRARGGLGLGLAIARELVQAHGGSVVAASPGKGRGSTFTVALPIPAILPAGTGYASSPGSDGTEPSISKVRVLVVEDDPDAREMVVMALQSRGALVRTASSAREARVSVEEEQPDVLVADIEMPHEDGYKLIQQLRESEKTGPENRLPSIALTAYASATDRERAITAGFDLHLTKPVDLPELVRSVARVSRPNV